MVVDHIHDDPESVAVEGLDHLLQFPDADRAVAGVGSIAAVGDVVVDRVIAPVEGVGVVFGHRTVVEHRHQLDMGDPQPLEIVQTGGMNPVVVQGGAGEGQGFVFAPQPVGHPAVNVVGKVLDVDLPDDVLGPPGRRGVLGPAGGIGPAQINHHAADAVPAAGPGPGVRRMAGDTLTVGDGVVVIAAVQIALHLGLPDAPFPPDQVDHQETFAVGAVVIEEKGDLAGSGRPEEKRGGLGRPEGAQGGVGVKLHFKGFRVVEFAAKGRRLGCNLHGNSFDR